MTVLALTKEPAALLEALHRVRDEGERIVIEEDGRPAGALVSLEDLKALEQLEDLLDVQDYQKALEEPL